MGSRAPTDDGVLLARLVAGDEQALGQAYDVYAPIVFGIARRVTADEQLARELTQDVFTFLWEMPERVDLTRGSVRAYLAVVAHRRAVDAVRRHASRARAETRAATRERDTGDGHEEAVVEDDARDSRSRRVRALLDQLPDEQRAALVLAYFEGHTYREVAVQLGIPEGTAKSRLRMGLARLRALLECEPSGALS